jgi:predicted nucleotidyltransferase
MPTDSKTVNRSVTAESLRSEIRRILNHHLDLKHYRVVLFGSESTGTALHGSDIDIGIEGDHRIPGRIMERIRQELEGIRTLRRFDVVDLSCTDENFKRAALKNAEQL